MAFCNRLAISSARTVSRPSLRPTPKSVSLSMRIVSSLAFISGEQLAPWMRNYSAQQISLGNKCILLLQYFY